MTFQLCMRDEYGQVTILSTGNDIKKLVAQGKADVSNENMENSLTKDEQKKNFEFFFVEITDKKNKVLPNVYYAGKRGNGVDYLYIVSKEELKEENLSSSKYGLRFYIGENLVDRKKNIVETYYALSAKGKEVNSLDAQELEGKTAYFVRKVR